MGGGGPPPPPPATLLHRSNCGEGLMQEDHPVTGTASFPLESPRLVPSLRIAFKIARGDVDKLLDDNFVG